MLYGCTGVIIANHLGIVDFSYTQVVDHSGLEPLTSPMPWVRSTR